MKKKALVILAPGFEELEATAPIDLLRRADVEVVVAARDDNLTIAGRCGMHVSCDLLLDTALEDTYDLVVVPGGPGHKLLRQDFQVHDCLRAHLEQGKLVGAICAAPVILKDAGVLPRKYTAHPSVAEELPDIQVKENVVEDGNIITSRGAGTSIEFALRLVSRLCSPELSCKIAGDICYGSATSKHA